MPTPVLQYQTRASTRESAPASVSHASVRSFRSETSSSFDTQSNNHKAGSSHSQSNTRRSKQSGAASSKSTGGKDGQSFVAAVVEGRGAGAEVGMCFCDLKTSEIILCQIADSQTYVRTLQKLNLYEPAEVTTEVWAVREENPEPKLEILVPTTAVDPVNSKLVNIIKETMPNSTITPVARRSFNDTTGLECIKKYIVKEGSASLLLGIPTKYFCLAATAAVMQHIVETRHAVFLNHSVRFKYQICTGSMVIDCATARNLELTMNLSSQNDKDTLFGILNETLTPMGARLLRSNILQPLTDERTIQTRLDCVQELSQVEDRFYALKSSLKTLNDVDHLITTFIQVPTKPSIKHSEQCINHIINLKHTLHAITSVAQSLGQCQNRLLVTIHRLLTDPRLEKFSDLIDEVIEKNVVLEKTAVGIRHQRCFAVKAGCNGLLDVARQTYKETCNDILDVTNRYVQEYGINLKVQFNVTMGYYFTTTVDQLGGNDVPLVFINVVKKGKSLTFTTLELVKKNAKINDSLTEVYLMSDKIVGDLSSNIRSEIGALYKASEAIAMLDMLLSFAHQCTISDFVRPEFTDTLVIKQGRHPILEKISPLAFIPNDTYAGSHNTFQIITGPNMSGKSTYLRQVALLTIMAQIASFVPAEYASFRIVDQLLSRICNDDCIELNASTFMTEMKETAYIVENATEKSLVVIDELGRGTSTHDGLGIAFAVCEELIHNRSLVFFATHFQELTTILTAYHNVMTRDEEQKPGISYKYRLAQGSAKEEHYGLSLAKTLSLPQNISTRAETVSLRLTDLQDSARRHSESNRIVSRRRILAQVAHDCVLIQKAAKGMTGEELAIALNDVQQTAVMHLLAIHREGQDKDKDKDIDKDMDKGKGAKEDICVVMG
ncbi:MutS protein msh4 [Linnemannia schmuckeri]|uniref:DNA mismatch repair protein MSH3 n=1 Tax=Linnemannia schmuckeri TaxID=64567 RepID=A0A9P5S505_9FUNG|nr:MutS protein msh4 [Linnemannia schmuckeri]